MQSTYKTPKEYISSLDEPRKSEIIQLDTLIRSTVPKLKPFMMGSMKSNMIAYGKYRYKSKSGQAGDWAVIALASQKNYISLFVSCITPQGYLAENYAKKLPKANIGKSCIRFTKLENVDLSVIKEVLLQAEKLGGMNAV